MKRILILLLCMALTLSLPLSGSCAALVTMSGTVAPDSGIKWISAMTVKPGADLKNPDSSDIGYITQATVGDDGSYSLEIPFEQLDGSMVLRSNIPLDKYIYVSSENGSADGNGTSTKPYNTLAAALSAASDANVIVLTDMITVPKNMTWSAKCGVVLTGLVPGASEVTGGLDLTGTVSLRFTAPVRLENMKLNTLATKSASENANKLFGCGNRFILGEGLTMTNPVDVFGGNTINNTAESTDLTIMSGTYRRIFGGGENSPVTGNTRVVVDGKINSQYSANDDVSNYYDSRIFGGGKNSGSDVGGNTEIIFRSGVIAYIFGGGSASPVAGDTYITVEGGRVMNIYGGMADRSTVYAGNSYINMSGGMAESIFGGSMGANFTGNAEITVTGGEILRRIYGGCYNNFDGGYATNYYVTGSTSIVIGPKCKLLTGGDLSWSNKMNSGIFAASRIGSNQEQESSAIIFADGAYESHGGKIGEHGGIYKDKLISHHDYIVKCSAGGDVRYLGDGAISVNPDAGKYAAVNGVKLFDTDYKLTSPVTEVEFKNGYTVENADVSALGTEGSVSAHLTAGAAPGKDDYLLAALYTSDGKLAGISRVKITSSGNYSFNIGKISSGGKYTVKIFVWNVNNLEPLIAPYIITVG